MMRHDFGLEALEGIPLPSGVPRLETLAESLGLDSDQRVWSLDNAKRLFEAMGGTFVMVSPNAVPKPGDKSMSNRITLPKPGDDPDGKALITTVYIACEHGDGPSQVAAVAIEELLMKKGAPVVVAQPHGAVTGYEPLPIDQDFPLGSGRLPLRDLPLDGGPTKTAFVKTMTARYGSWALPVGCFSPETNGFVGKYAPKYAVDALYMKPRIGYVALQRFLELYEGPKSQLDVPIRKHMKSWFAERFYGAGQWMHQRLPSGDMPIVFVGFGKAVHVLLKGLVEANAQLESKAPLRGLRLYALQSPASPAPDRDPIDHEQYFNQLAHDMEDMLT